mgnify:FL=1
MKNILITFLFKEGAGPVFTLEMARGLALNGCNIYVILSHKISNRIDWETEKLFKEVYFIDTGTQKTAIQASFKFFLKEKFKIKSKYKSLQFDYAISTFYHPWASSVLKCVKAKRITICHDPIHHSGVKILEKTLTFHYIKSSDEIIVLTRSFIPLVSKNFGFSEKHIHYMPHGRMSEYRKKETLLPSDHNYMDKKTINFLFFGRIEKYKGIQLLAKAYKELVQTHSLNITLTIAGSGNLAEYREECRNIPNVTIINRYIPDNEIGQYFSIPNTIVVLPYIDASQSGVIPIALEYNTPIIASETGGLKEQLNNGEIGIFCKVNDINSLKEKMAWCIHNPGELKEEQKKMASYLHELDWEVITRIIINI